MAIETRINNQEYERLALAAPDRKWELWDGRPREKPSMTFEHNQAALNLGHLLLMQLDKAVYRVRIDAGRVHRTGATFFIPDVYVFPLAHAALLRNRPGVLEVYDQPLPLVAEVWSRSTGDYDVEEKLAAYKQRSDHEIWSIPTSGP